MANHKETVTLNSPTKIGGAWHEAGDSVEVYPFQRRHLVAYGGYVSGGPEDMASDGEKDAGALEVFKKADKREDLDGGIWSVDRVFAENDTASSEESSRVGSTAKPK